MAPRDAKLEPGGKTTVDVVVKDAKGQPVSGAELAIAVVDEAVLALTNYQMADPMSVFYSQRAGWRERSITPAPASCWSTRRS